MAKDIRWWAGTCTQPAGLAYMHKVYFIRGILLAQCARLGRHMRRQNKRLQRQKRQALKEASLLSPGTGHMSHTPDRGHRSRGTEFVDTSGTHASTFTVAL